MIHNPASSAPSADNMEDTDEAEWNRLKEIANLALWRFGRAYRLDADNAIERIHRLLRKRAALESICHPLLLFPAVLCCTLSNNHPRVVATYGEEAVDYLRQRPGVARCMVAEGFLLPPGI